MLDRMVQEEKLRQRKQRRRLNEKRQKQLVKMQLNMTTPKDIGMDQGGDGLFTTNVKPGRTQIPKPEADYAGHDEVDVDDLDESMTEYETQGEENNEDDSDLDDDERRLRELDRELNEGYEQFLDRMRERDAKLDIKRKREEEGEFKGFSDDDDDDSASSTGDGQGSGADSESESSDEAAIQTMKLRAKQKKKAQKLGLTLDDDENGDSGKVVAGKGVPAKLSKKAAMWFDQPLFKNVASDSEDSDDEEGKHSVSTTAKLISKRKRGD
ncbi:AdoMet-dependent rRNA methyltransferase spb1, partial [Spiromyces aspiralis]